MDASELGVDALELGASAPDAIETLKTAIQTVSEFRSDPGAVQNRLEHAVNNLNNVAENTSAAEAQIRDTDMATEMVRYSNNNILAQANQSNQGAPALLQ